MPHLTASPSCHDISAALQPCSVRLLPRPCEQISQTAVGSRSICSSTAKNVPPMSSKQQQQQHYQLLLVQNESYTSVTAGRTSEHHSSDGAAAAVAAGAERVLHQRHCGRDIRASQQRLLGGTSRAPGRSGSPRAQPAPPPARRRRARASTTVPLASRTGTAASPVCTCRHKSKDAMHAMPLDGWRACDCKIAIAMKRKLQWSQIVTLHCLGPVSPGSHMPIWTAGKFLENQVRICDVQTAAFVGQCARFGCGTAAGSLRQHGLAVHPLQRCTAAATVHGKPRRYRGAILRCPCFDAARCSVRSCWGGRGSRAAWPQPTRADAQRLG